MVDFGRHTRLRSERAKAQAGSTPVAGTIFSNIGGRDLRVGASSGTVAAPASNGGASHLIDVQTNLVFFTDPLRAFALDPHLLH